MVKGNFTEEFKLDAIKQITERGYSVADVSKRLGVSTHSLYPPLTILILFPTASLRRKI